MAQSHRACKWLTNMMSLMRQPLYFPKGHFQIIIMIISSKCKKKSFASVIGSTAESLICLVMQCNNLNRLSWKKSFKDQNIQVHLWGPFRHRGALPADRVQTGIK